MNRIHKNDNGETPEIPEFLRRVADAVVSSTLEYMQTVQTAPDYCPPCLVLFWEDDTLGVAPKAVRYPPERPSFLIEPEEALKSLMSNEWHDRELPPYMLYITVPMIGVTANQQEADDQIKALSSASVATLKGMVMSGKIHRMLICMAIHADVANGEFCGWTQSLQLDNNGKAVQVMDPIPLLRKGQGSMLVRSIPRNQTS